MKKEKQMNNKKLLIIGIITVVAVTLITLGLTYAFFVAGIEGNDTATETVIETGELKLIFTDTEILTIEDALPGESASKTFTIENVGTIAIEYDIVLTDLINEFVGDELVYTISSDNNGGAVAETPVPTNDSVLLSASIEPGVTQTYTITITFKETGSNQNFNMGAVFSGKLQINERTAVYCTYDGELVEGVEYVNGQYTYRYLQEASPRYVSETDSYVFDWYTIDNGWGVVLTDYTSTEPVTSDVCTYINDIPVTSYQNMYYRSQAPSIDLSSLNTSNVTNMSSMFLYSQATTLDVSNFDTSNVTNMWGMFFSAQATTLDVSRFNTSNVTNMYAMFCSAEVSSLDLSSFDTSNVTNMAAMLQDLKVESLDISNFDTSNVTTMGGMFSQNEASEIIGLNKLNTKNVSHMAWMFAQTKMSTIDLSNFDTSNVTNMVGMFSSAQATEIIGLTRFDTTQITSTNQMFRGTQVAVLDLSSFDLTNVTDTNQMLQDTTATVGYARTQADADKLNTAGSPWYSYIPDTLRFVVK